MNFVVLLSQIRPRISSLNGQLISNNAQFVRNEAHVKRDYDSNLGDNLLCNLFEILIDIRQNNTKMVFFLLSSRSWMWSMQLLQGH